MAFVRLHPRYSMRKRHCKETLWGLARVLTSIWLVLGTTPSCWKGQCTNVQLCAVELEHAATDCNKTNILSCPATLGEFKVNLWDYKGIILPQKRLKATYSTLYC